MNYLTNGEVAKLMDISKYTLRYYIDEGLIQPKKITKNNYQYFSENNIYKLYLILFLRKLGFNIQDIKKSRK